MKKLSSLSKKNQQKQNKEFRMKKKCYLSIDDICGSVLSIKFSNGLGCNGFAIPDKCPYREEFTNDKVKTYEQKRNRRKNNNDVE